MIKILLLVVSLLFTFTTIAQKDNIYKSYRNIKSIQEKSHIRYGKVIDDSIIFKIVDCTIVVNDSCDKQHIGNGSSIYKMVCIGQTIKARKSENSVKRALSFDCVDERGIKCIFSFVNDKVTKEYYIMISYKNDTYLYFL